MNYDSFSSKWEKINKEKNIVDEKTLYTEKEDTPVTQRQLNLYYYFLFISEIFKKDKIKEVLEVGCGRGTMSLFLASYLGIKVSMLDSEKNALDIARKSFDEHGLRADYYQADALSTSLGGESFDSVVSIGLAEHIDEVDKLYKEQCRLLRSGGVMISLNIPKKFSVQFLNDIMKFFKYLFLKKDEYEKNDYYRNKLKPKDYKRIAEKVGFKNVEITHVCPFPIYVPISIKIDKKITKMRKMILKMRKIFQKYPYKTNYFMSQGHFLVGYKK